MNCDNILKIILMFAIVWDYTACLCFFSLSRNGSNKAYGWHESTKIQIRYCQLLLGVDSCAAQQPLCHQWWWYGPNIFGVLLHEKHLHAGDHLQSRRWFFSLIVTTASLDKPLVILWLFVLLSLSTLALNPQQYNIYTHYELLQREGQHDFVTAQSFLCLHYTGQNSSLRHV